MPNLSEVPSSGFGYPHDGVSPIHSRKPFSASYALGLRPTKHFSEILIEHQFPDAPSVLALYSKTSSALNRRFNGLLPRPQPYPFALPEGLVLDRVIASLGFLTSKVLSLPTRPKGLLHLSVPLIRLGSKSLTTLSSTLFRDSRTQEARHFPLARAPAFRAFLTVQHSTLFNDSRPADYFFIFKRPAILQKPSRLSLRAVYRLLTGERNLFRSLSRQIGRAHV